MATKNIISKGGVFKKAPMSESTDADNRFIVNTTMVSPESAVSEKTIGEILSAYNQGKIVTFRTYGFPDYEYIDVDMYSVSKTDDGKFAVSAMAVDELNDLLINAFISYTSNMEDRGVAVRARPLTAGNRFTVTLTPTAADYSGTMDKTVAEMTEAYYAGKEIVWRVILASNEYVDVKVTAVMANADYEYPSFNAYVIEIRTGVLVYAHIPKTNDGTVQTYSTELYTLTPAT